MISISINDYVTPLLSQLMTRSYGFAQEGLQVAGAHVAREARKEMNKMGHHWFNAVTKEGKYTIIHNRNAMKILGKRISHKTGEGLSPPSMANLISFYLAPHSLTVVVGGAHPRFRPIAFKHGLPNGYYGKPIGAVGKAGKAILHKLNTGEVTAENPRSQGSMIANAKYVKNRRFMDRGFNNAMPHINKSLTERFKDSLDDTVNNLPVQPIKRSS